MVMSFWFDAIEIAGIGEVVCFLFTSNDCNVTDCICVPGGMERSRPRIRIGDLRALRM